MPQGSKVDSSQKEVSYTTCSLKHQHPASLGDIPSLKIITVHMRYALFIHLLSDHMCKFHYFSHVHSSNCLKYKFICTLFICMVIHTNLVATLFQCYLYLIVISLKLLLGTFVYSDASHLYWLQLHSIATSTVIFAKKTCQIFYNHTHGIPLIPIVLCFIIYASITDLSSLVIICCHMYNFYCYDIMSLLWTVLFLHMINPSVLGNFIPCGCYYCSILFLFLNKQFLYFYEKNIVGYHYAHENYEFFNSNNNSNNNIDYDKMVVNLSDITITVSEKKLLARGLKFCPNPGEPDYRLYKDDLDAFHLKLKRELYFKEVEKPTSSDEEDDTPIHINDHTRIDPNSPFSDRNFKLPSDWVPPVLAPLKYFIQQNESSLNRTKLPKYNGENISADERAAIKKLLSNKNITIKPADKGGAVVVMNTTDYINEGLRQLSDHKFYIETDDDLTDTHKQAIHSKIKNMEEDKEIDLKCHDYLMASKCRTSLFYMLPKIHKRLKDPPGRPIVSGNGCPTEKISQLVDHFLQPHVKQLPSYIKDTTHFLQKLQTLGSLPEGSLLVTLDVASLYTNIPNNECLEAARLALYRGRGLRCNPSNDSLIALLRMVLTMNNFDFAGRHYLQVGGTAMGTKVAPSFANTFMGWFENIYVYTYHKQPHIWVRFIDDIFVIWTFGENELQEFISYLNNCLPSIKFEADMSPTTVNFLDVKVHLSPQGDLSTRLYTKPTDAHNYLSYTSCHPPKCKDSIPYSQFLRLRRICSHNDDFTNEAREMAGHFHRAGYPKKLLQEAFDKAYRLERQQLLQYHTPIESEVEKEKRLYLITTFHPSGSVLDKIISRNWDILDRSSSTRPLLEYRLIKGYRRPKNVRDLLIRALTFNPWDVQGQPPIKDPSDDPKNRACTRNNCRYCDRLDTGGRMLCTLTNSTYTTIRNCNCESNNLIYCIECKICHKMYVGQTKRSLRSRMCEHFRNVTQNNTLIHSVGRHFNEPGHSGITDMTTYVLQFARGHPDSDSSLLHRLDLEQNWMCTLRTKVPEGLNVLIIKNLKIKKK